MEWRRDELSADGAEHADGEEPQITPITRIQRGLANRTMGGPYPTGLSGLGPFCVIGVICG